MDVTINLAAVVLLLAANRFLVAAEFALVKARSFRIASLADGGRIVGILLARDIFKALLGVEDVPWPELRRFCREPLVVPEAKRVSELFELMRQERAHMALVIDEYGGLSGIVTLEGLIEEIVGEIQDETDSEEGRRVIERAAGVEVAPMLEANTLSGFSMERLARLPR